ncbi:MAG: metallopeptidase TldD-related protein [Chromatiales bacterium]|nr:metallopeptidase TldD-related protein [Chromatiales bacterium]
MTSPTSPFAYRATSSAPIVAGRARRMRAALGASDAGGRGLAKASGLSVIGAQGRGRERSSATATRALGVTRLPRPAARQRQHLGLLAGGAARRRCEAAYDIARFTAEDPAAGLPDDRTCRRASAARDLDLFHPWDARRRRRRSSWRGAARRRRFAVEPADRQLRGRQRLGAAVALLCSANTPRLPRRLCRARATTLSVRADRAATRRRHAARRLVHARRATPRDLAAPEAVGRLRRASARWRGWARASCATRRGAGAVRGAAGRRPARQLRAGRQRRRALPQGHRSCVDCLGKPVLRAARRHRTRTRTCRKGTGSAPFDDEGVRDARRATWSTAASLQGYFLSSYSARKLGMQHHRQRRRRAQPGAASRLTRARRRLRGDAAQARHAACWSPS